MLRVLWDALRAANNRVVMLLAMFDLLADFDCVHCSILLQ